MCAPTFDPVVALAAPAGSVKLPYPKAAPLDNIARFHSKTMMSKATKEQHRLRSQQKLEKEQRKKELAASHPFHPDNPNYAANVAAAQTSKKKKRRKRLTVLELMDVQSAGPLGVLLKSLRSKSRVAVRVRRLKGHCGTCEGVVIAFDKHMNLVLENVHEVYTTTEYKPRTVALTPTELAALSKRQQTKLKHFRVAPVRKTRSVHQLFIKGGSVILVAAPAAA